MKLFDLFETVKIDNVKGLGEVPDNQNVDYLGLRVSMRPSVFLKLAASLPREQAQSAEYIKQHLEKGGGIAAPWLVISVPPEWEDNDLKQPARVVGHEGRNRMYAVIETEGDSPVGVEGFVDKLMGPSLERRFDGGFIRGGDGCGACLVSSGFGCYKALQ